MQIILQEDIEKVGTRGQVVDVAEGYARNYLLPRKMAIPATPGNLKQLEKIRGALAKRTATERESAARLAEMLNGVTITISRKAGETDQLFGSVTAADLAEGLAAQKYQIDRRRIQLDEPIKLLGEYPVTIKLFQDITATVKVIVRREE